MLRNNIVKKKIYDHGVIEASPESPSAKKLASMIVDKTLLFRGMTIEKFPLCVKEKVTTTYVASGWIAVQRFFRNMR